MHFMILRRRRCDVGSPDVDGDLHLFNHSLSTVGDSYSSGLQGARSLYSVLSVFIVVWKSLARENFSQNACA